MIRLGIIGYGYWGPNLVRNFRRRDDCKVVAVCDSSAEQLKQLAKAFPEVQGVSDSGPLFADPTIDAIVIATPVFTHYPLAKLALENGKHVLLEKPMATSVEECERLVDLAAKKNLTLMVDHTFLYTGAVERMKKLLDDGSLGNVKYLDSIRINLGLFQSDVNVLWDLAPHDLSILTYLHDEEPHSINATGSSHTDNEIENIAYMTVNYNSGFIAHISCSWSSPVKVRMMLLGGDKKMVLYNDVEPTEKLKVYDTTYQHKTDEEKQKVLVDYRVGDIFVPKIGQHEALASVAADFIGSISNGTVPRSSSSVGLKVVKLLEAAQQSLRARGSEILLQ